MIITSASLSVTDAIFPLPMRLHGVRGEMLIIILNETEWFVSFQIKCVGNIYEGNMEMEERRKERKSL